MSKSRSIITNIEDFVTRVQDIHGDKYDYTQVIYTGRKNQVKVICNLHGEFYVFADKFSCPRCFIEKSPIIHNDKYTYENFVYTKSRNKPEVTCPAHGGFLVSPNVHLSGTGCPICAEHKKKTPSTK